MYIADGNSCNFHPLLNTLDRHTYRFYDLIAFFIYNIIMYFTATDGDKCYWKTAMKGKI